MLDVSCNLAKIWANKEKYSSLSWVQRTLRIKTGRIPKLPVWQNRSKLSQYFARESVDLVQAQNVSVPSYPGKIAKSLHSLGDFPHD